MAKKVTAYDKEMSEVRDAVVCLVKTGIKGLLIVGRGGTGKTHTVIETLQKQGIHYQHHKTRVTTAGLFQALAQYPESIHVIEDVESIFSEQNFSGVMRSATDSNEPRMIEWRTARGKAVNWRPVFNKLIEDGITGTEDESAAEEIFTEYFEGRRYEKIHFMGKIIIVANVKMDMSKPDNQALATRFLTLTPFEDIHEKEARLLDRHDMAIAEKMKQISAKGYARLRMSPKECLTVADTVIEACKEYGTHIDLRLLTEKGFNLYGGRRSMDNEWREFLRKQIRLMALSTNKTEEKLTEKAIALEIKKEIGTYRNQVLEFAKRTKREQHSFEAVRKAFDRAVKQ